jgi:hypothetical protein
MSPGGWHGWASVYCWATFQHRNWLSRRNPPSSIWGRVVCLTHGRLEHPQACLISSHSEALAELSWIHPRPLSPQHKFDLRMRINPRAKNCFPMPMDASLLPTSPQGPSN